MGTEGARGSQAGAPTASAPAEATPWLAQAVATLARELHDHHAPTAAHSHRAARVARAVAEELRLDALDATEVELVAMLHDVGKLAIDPALLDFPGRLSDDQLERMRRHTIEGEELLARTAGLEQLAPAVRATHEAWDGSGYPDGLRGDEIPLTARIVAVVDAYDAMVSARAYRTALPWPEATRRLHAGAGVQFDPGVVEALLRVLRREGRA
jgi:HD-GYP domain-containing protein (c-di-GMP phosphodiesterase class II)